MLEFIIAYKIEIAVLVILVFLLFLFWFSGYKLNFLKYGNKKLMLNLKTGRFCHISGVPIEELSSLVAAMDTQRLFVYDLEGLMPVRLNRIYRESGVEHYSAVISLVEKKDVCEVISFEDDSKLENVYDIGTKNVVYFKSSNGIIFRCPNKNGEYKIGDIYNVSYKIDKINYEGHILNRFTLKLTN
ncbi:MAG: hypothetical protein ACK5N8_03135 [Alphaproteobacteria bacterium]